MEPTKINEIFFSGGHQAGIEQSEKSTFDDKEIKRGQLNLFFGVHLTNLVDLFYSL